MATRSLYFYYYSLSLNQYTKNKKNHLLPRHCYSPIHLRDYGSPSHYINTAGYSKCIDSFIFVKIKLKHYIFCFILK